eukprot:TRINITY_DN5851_c0_g1_i2.p1 TRINITY_DN5851_c0_g1~~TRINITY_DN5851_c0_g1_i2.p1  ORF type:complete len:751 (+),score=141.85 TRINITY_DN5851_c0_g1_i2:56-2254(+)
MPVVPALCGHSSPIASPISESHNRKCSLIFVCIAFQLFLWILRAHTSAPFQFSWPGEGQSGGFILPLGRRDAPKLPDVKSTAHYKGEKLSDGSAWLYGNIVKIGYYYTTVWLGSPGQRFTLMVDSGSSLTYVPCNPCESCGTHQDPAFVPHKSSSFYSISCQSSNCPVLQCDGDMRCYFSESYLEGSSVNGFYASDLLSLGKSSSISSTQAIFGCDTMETGLMFTQRVDGVMGLGRGNLSIIKQLVDAKAIDDVFSLCYGGMDVGGGVMVLGSAGQPKGMTFTPLNTSEPLYYSLTLQQIRVKGRPLNVSSEVFQGQHGAVLDSGTTLTYVPRVAYSAFKAEVAAQLKGQLQQVSPPAYNLETVCYKGAGSDPGQLSKYFPRVELVFLGGAVQWLSPENYLFRHRHIAGAYCLGIVPDDNGGTLLGAITVLNTLVTYDRAQMQVGFWKTDCNLLYRAFDDVNTTSAPSSSPDRNSSSLPLSLAPPMNTTFTPSWESLSSFSPPAVQPGVIQGGLKTMDVTGCQGCASMMLVTMTLSIGLDAFKDLRAEFVDDMERELGLEKGQVKLDYFKEEDNSGSHGIILRFRIVPYSGISFIPATSVEKVKDALLNRHRIGLRDAFGSYNVTYIYIEPYTSQRSGLSVATWVGVGVAALAAISAAVTWTFLWRRHVSACFQESMASDAAAAVGCGGGGMSRRRRLEEDESTTDVSSTSDASSLSDRNSLTPPSPLPSHV